jgi:endonuclease/exonuclease/phosphatase family metal-dependent hydrolase
MATICSFNVNNLYVRYKFDDVFPGDPSRKSAVDDPAQGYLPMYNPTAFELFNPLQRQLAARALKRESGSLPDVVLLQEVESLIALRAFNETMLGSFYERALLIDSRDLRQIDVGVLSRLPIVSTRTHVDDVDSQGAAADPRLFSRDCLELTVELPQQRRLTIFVNHLKSKFIGREANTPAKRAAAKQRNDAKRKRQSRAIVRLLRERFPGSAFDQELFMVVGDLNDEPGSDPVAPVVADAGLENALERIPTQEDRWTHWFRGGNSVAQLDYLLLSPALSTLTQGRRPVIERRGISFDRTLADGGPGPRRTRYHRRDDDPNPIGVDFRFPRFAEVTAKDYASDHCPVFFDVP